jgi:hypothetical protein
MSYVSFVALTLLAAIAGFVFAIAAAVVMAARKTATPRRRKLWIGVPAILGLLPAIVVFAPMMATTAYNGLRPDSWAYEDVFGSSPAAQAALQSATRSGFDTTRIYIAVDRTSEASAQISQFVSERSPIDNSDMADSIASDGDAPDWWRAGRNIAKKRVCADVIQSHFVDVGEWTNLIIADCPSQKRIFVLAIR